MRSDHQRRDETVSLNEERWQAIDDAFTRVVERAPTEAKAFLAEYYANDPSLVAEVEELLKHDRELRSPAHALDPSTDPDEIGPYRITGVLGRGGMGIVYRAEQSSPVERVVAIKLVRLGLDSTTALERFVGEQQALALMNHVNVATVYRLGQTTCGRPYLAMEYVDGQNLCVHCDHKHLTIRQRVRLFLQVCDGVQHAHQKGIIHRDLKPSNVLVKGSSGEPPTPKLIDFGIAKSLTRKLNPNAEGTHLGVLLGTLHYSSPEQITGRYAEVDTRSDIYSLGVMLYELLAGTPPRDQSDFQGRTQFELAEMLESSETPTLVSRFTRQEDCQSVANRRGATVPEMRQVLSGDLSWVVSRCLERDPDARYPSVNDLQRDLVAWLERKPVEARRASGVYRARKFVERHWRLVTVSGVAALLVLLTTTLAIAGFVSSRQAEQRAVRSAQEAERAAEEAALAAEFQTKVLRSINPKELGRTLRVRLAQAVQEGVSGTDGQTSAALSAFQSLVGSVNFTDLQVETLERTVFKAAEESITRDYGEHPLLQASLWQSLADTLWNLGITDAALESQEKALAAREQLLPPDHELILQSLDSRSNIRNHLFDVDGMLEDSARVLEGRRRNGQKEPLAQALYGHATNLWTVHRPDEGVRLAREALELWQELRGPSGEETLQAAGRLGQVLIAAGHLSDGEKILRTTLAQLEKAKAPDPAFVFGLRRDRAGVLAWQGKAKEADALMRSVVAESTDVLGARHPLALYIRYAQGRVLLEQERFGEAEELYDELTSLIVGNPAVYALLADARLHQGKLDSAEAALQKIPPSTPEYFRTVELTMRTELLRQKQRYTEAVSTGQRALNTIQELKLDRFITFAAQRPLARTFHDMKHFEEAERILKDAWSALTEIPGGERPRLLRYTAQDMVGLYTEWSRATPDQAKANALHLWEQRLRRLRAKQ
ncbi:MAG: protein kinase [Myxococcota bacterium]